MVDLHAQTLLDSSAGRVHSIFPFLGLKIVVKERFFSEDSSYRWINHFS
jgi:hypothetical protein